MKIELDANQKIELGGRIANLLHLRTIGHGDQKGRYDTAVGTKTLEGLGAMVLRYLNEIQGSAAEPQQPDAPIPEQDRPDVYSLMWGYEQTNYDFFQAVKVTEKTVTFRKLKKAVVWNEDRTSGGKCRPIFDVFDGEEQFRIRFDSFQKEIQDGQEVLASFFYLGKCYRLWEGDDKEFTCWG